ncbi:MAG TPA: PhoU domain-containing protein [Nitrososphaerales archaeon]|nr:PhoU domain-containing protein [Nitrososphaerales archaeon]
MVALPKKWVKEMGLEQGSEVTITKLSAASLLVNAQPDIGQGAGREATFEVGVDDSPATIFRKIVSLYVIGYSRIIIEGPRGYFSPSKKDTIKDMVRRHLIGTEGVAESRDRMTIHILLGYTELSVESALKKMLLIIDSLKKDATQALETNDAVLAEATVERKEEVGRFELYVIRQLNLSLNQGVLPDLKLENRDTLGYILVARSLERIAHHVSNLTKAVTALDKPLAKPVIQRVAALNERACALVDESLLALFKRDSQGADAVVQKAESFVDSEMEFVRSLNGSDSHTYYVLHVLLDSQRRIAEHAKDIAEAVLDMTVERTLKKEELPIPQILYSQ